MWNRRLPRALPALAVAALVVATPALAAPSLHSGLQVRIAHILADWWGELTGPLVSVFAGDEVTVDAENGAPTAAGATDEPTVDTEHRHGVDPDG